MMKVGSTGRDWLGLFGETADAVGAALAGFDRWSAPGDWPDQYALDQIADEAALGVLEAAGVGVLSEESGLRRAGGSEVVIIDPVDGSTNASRRIPHYCISLCAVEADALGELHPVAGLVRHLVSGEQFTATLGESAKLNGEPITPSGCTEGTRAVVGVSGRPGGGLPVWQVRVLGAAALDLCAVACGRLDAYIDLNSDHGVWDYAAGAFICAQAGAHVAETEGRPLYHLEHGRRLGPMAAATPELAAVLGEARHQPR